LHTTTYICNNDTIGARPQATGLGARIDILL
jgi:hypothetical protein